MDFHGVTMDPAVADEAFQQYRAAFAAEHARIDGELMRGYKALAEGKTLISLLDTIQKGGVDEMGRPKLAIARADERTAAMNRTTGGALAYWPGGAPRATALDRVFSFPEGSLPQAEGWERSLWRTSRPWEASLPFIPPKYRPPHGLVNYHLLWEAEWRQRPGPQRRDPILLRRIGGDLFAVVAAWDLTEIEKLVLAR